MRQFSRLFVVLAILLSGSVLAPYAAFPSERFGWQSLTGAYQPLETIYLPVILRNYTTPSVPPPTPPPSPTGPDLVVTAISVVPDPPEAGQSATVYVTVKNQGNQPVAYGNNFYVDFYVKADQTTLPQLLERGDLAWGVQGSWFDVGESRTLEDSYTFTAGTRYLYAQADTDSTVTETGGEDNNVLGPMPLNVTGLGGSRAPIGPAVIPVRGMGIPRPTPRPRP